LIITTETVTIIDEMKIVNIFPEETSRTEWNALAITLGEIYKEYHGNEM